MAVDARERETIVKAVVEPMVDFYDAPEGAKLDESRRKRILAAYIDGLVGYDERTLRLAWKAVFSTHTRWTWPLPAQFIRECEKVGCRVPGPFGPFVAGTPEARSAYEGE